jgi:hypothetical protein
MVPFGHRKEIFLPSAQMWKTCVEKREKYAKCEKLIEGVEVS